MAKPGRPITNPRTAKRNLLKSPPPYIAQRIAGRKAWDIYPFEEVLKEDMDRHHKLFEMRRKQLQITFSQLEAIADRCSVDPSDEDFLKALSAVKKSKIRIAVDAAKGGNAKSQLCQPVWHSEAIRLAKKIKLSRVGIEEKLSSSRLSELVLNRWSHPTINKPSHRTLRAYLTKSL